MKIHKGAEYLLDLTSPQDSPLGNILCHLYYNSSSLLSLAPKRSGFPHNGWSHSFSISGSLEDLCAYLDLLIDYYSPYKSCSKGVAVLSKVKKALMDGVVGELAIGNF